MIVQRTSCANWRSTDSEGTDFKPERGQHHTNALNMCKISVSPSLPCKVERASPVLLEDAPSN